MGAMELKGHRGLRRRILRLGFQATSLLAAGLLSRRGWGQAVLHASDDVGTDEMLRLTARAAVEHIRHGDMRAEAYVRRLLAQYGAHRDLNPIVSIDRARLLESARAVDLARARGTQLGPAAGLPFAVKDQIAVAGYPATGGNAALLGYIPKQSAPVVDALIKAGAIVFAKTNLPDMVTGNNFLAIDATYNRFFGGTHNPYDITRIPGGTSGGNAVAIAARMVPAAIGEDTGGSVRWPAALCGICGLRPSTYTIENALHGTRHKRYSDAGIIIPPAGPMDTFGPMARTVADVAFLDALITRESTTSTALHRVRIGVPRQDYWSNRYVDQGLANVILAAFEKLRAAGAQLVEIDFNAVVEIPGGPVERMLDDTQAKNIAQWLRDNLPAVRLEELYEGGVIPAPKPPSIEPVAAEKQRILTAAAHQYEQVFRSHGIAAIAFPTSPIPAPPIDPRTGWDVQKMMVNGKALDEDEVFNKNHLSWGALLGAPGLTIPAGLSAGLPIGLELEGLPGSDRHILGLGMAVENVLGPIQPPPFIS